MKILFAASHRGRGIALACGALFLACAPAHGQVRPDAGSTQRDLEQRPLEVPRAAPRLPAAPARPALQGDATQRFVISALTISGNTAFPAETLLGLVREELVGKTVTLAQLQEAAAKITAFYRSRGYLVARAYIPAQRIAGAGAQIEIAVLEGVLGEVKIDNRSRLSEATVRRFASPLQPGAPLTLDTLERPILLLSDQAGAGGVNPVIKPGASIGSSDLALELAPASLAAGLIEADNHGNRFTGRDRLGAQLSLLSPLGMGESLNASLTKSTQGALTSAALSGALPLGGDGLKVGASYGETRYRLGGEFAALRASGSARSAGVLASYPLVRSQRWNLNATLAQDARRLEDRVASTDTVTPKETRATSATLGGDVRDVLAANSVVVWNVSATAGRLSIDEPGARAADAATAMTQGAYRKYSLALLYLQALDRDWTVYASLRAQRAGKNLDSSEKFSLGGPQGVRAYPVGEAAGDEGELATLEVRYALAPWLGATPSVVLFADWGHVRINDTPFTAGANSRSLGAAGPGLTLAKAGDFSVRAYWAARTGGQAATADADRRSRIWLQAAKFF